MNQFLEYKGYQAMIEYSSEDRSFVGKVLGIKDMLLFEGETVREITEMFHTSIDDYLAVCDEIGKKPELALQRRFDSQLSQTPFRNAVPTAQGSNRPITQASL